MSKSKVTMKEKKTDLSNTHVPDKIYAYSLQIRHAIYELLKAAPDDTISIEVFDDIGIESTSGSKKAVQAKSSLSENNPVSNRSVDLWKTFYNWILATKANELDINKTNFIIFVAANKSGSIVRLFNDADTTDDSKLAYNTAKLEFYDIKGKENALADGYALYVRECFNIANLSIMLKIISKFKLETINESHTAWLYNSFSQLTSVSDDLMEDAFLHMLGWTEKTTAQMVESHKPMLIRQQDFKKELIAITRILNQNKSLLEMAGSNPTWMLLKQNIML